MRTYVHEPILSLPHLCDEVLLYDTIQLVSFDKQKFTDLICHHVQ